MPACRSLSLRARSSSAHARQTRTTASASAIGTCCCPAQLPRQGDGSNREHTCRASESAKAMQHVGDRAEHEHTRRAHATSTPHSQCTPRCPARMPRGVCTRAKPSRLGHHRACTCAVPACDNDAAPGQAARPRDCRTAAARSWVRPLERQTLGSDICRGKCKSGCTRSKSGSGIGNRESYMQAPPGDRSALFAKTRHSFTPPQHAQPQSTAACPRS